jgi:hypothetical protein
MKNPKFTYATYVLAFALAFAAPLGTLRAELTSEEVQEDSITPERDSLEEEVVILKKKPARATAKKRIVVREESLPEEMSYEPVLVQRQAQAQSQAQAAAPAPTMGSALDQGVQTKMDGVKQKFEEAILRSLDRIQVTVDDGGGNQNQVQTQGVTIVKDNVVNSPGTVTDSYLSIEKAPAYDEGGESVAVDNSNGNKSSTSLRLSPILGWSSINSDFYEVDSRYTAGINLEVDVGSNLSVAAGYSYSQYEVRFGSAYSAPMYYPGFVSGNAQKFQYNQNVFDVTTRLYLFPRESVFRMFLGAGGGYNKGYLSYKNIAYNSGAPNAYANVQDYEVNSFLGILETGAEVNVSKNVAIGTNFKYAMVFSSSESSYGYPNNGYGMQAIGDALSDASFYSILGTVKVSF